MYGQSYKKNVDFHMDLPQKHNLHPQNEKNPPFLADDTQEGGRRKERGNPGRRIQVKVW